MIPPFYDMPMQFMPSQATLNAWLKTKKSNGQNKPGIFETVDFAGDQVWAISAILIEISAFVITLVGAWRKYMENHSMTMLITALIIVFLFIIFDIFGIMLHGQDHPQRVKLRSEMVITHNPAIKAHILKKIKETSWREFLGFMLLILSGILKILAIAVFFSAQSGMVAVIILILFYMLVIYIHAYHTGYWWAARNVKVRIKRDFNSFLNHQQAGTPNPFLVKGPQIVLFQSNVPMGISIAHHGRQTIQLTGQYVAPNGATFFDYSLSSTGCLFDYEIVSMAASYNPSFSAALIEACIKLQFLQLGLIAPIPTNNQAADGQNPNYNNPVVTNQNIVPADGNNNADGNGNHDGNNNNNDGNNSGN